MRKWLLREGDEVKPVNTQNTECWPGCWRHRHGGLEASRGQLLTSIRVLGKLLNLPASAWMLSSEKDPTESAFHKTGNLLAHETGKSKAGWLQAQLHPEAQPMSS